MDTYSTSANHIQAKFNERFGTDSNTSATLFITLFVFILGLLFQQLFVLYSKFIERRKIRKIFQVALRQFIKETSKQSSLYKKDSENYQMEKKTSFTFTRGSIFTCSSIQELGFEKTYAAFFLGIENWGHTKSSLRQKAFIKIWGSVKSVEFWHNASFSDRSQFLEKYNSINEKRNIAIENHRKLYEKAMTNLDGVKAEKAYREYVQALDAIHVSWQNNPNRTRPDVLHEELVTPILDLNRGNHKFPLAISLNDNLLPASLEYENQLNFLKAQKKQTLAYYWAFRSYARISKKSLEILDWSLLSAFHLRMNRSL